MLGSCQIHCHRSSFPLFCQSNVIVNFTFAVSYMFVHWQLVTYFVDLHLFCACGRKESRTWYNSTVSIHQPLISIVSSFNKLMTRGGTRYANERINNDKQGLVIIYAVPFQRDRPVLTILSDSFIPRNLGQSATCNYFVNTSRPASHPMWWWISPYIVYELKSNYQVLLVSVCFFRYQKTTANIIFDLSTSRQWPLENVTGSRSFMITKIIIILFNQWILLIVYNFLSRDMRIN